MARDVMEELRRRIVSGSPLERVSAAEALKRRGPEGWDELAALARDETLSSDVRVAAASGLEPPVSGTMLQEAAASLLASSDPVLRYRGMILCARFGLIALLPRLAASFDDPATFWEIDVEISLATVAQAAAEFLRTGSPPHDFDWSAVSEKRLTK